LARETQAIEVLLGRSEEFTVGETVVLPFFFAHHFDEPPELEVMA
jgi:hypothetical protein